MKLFASNILFAAMAIISNIVAAPLAADHAVQAVDHFEKLARSAHADVGSGSGDAVNENQRARGGGKNPKGGSSAESGYYPGSAGGACYPPTCHHPTD
ncbi:unnamed protein product [Zymoseptoria tritici ST99CH_1E4]|uniref:Uncharacterized protein n=1 Tax=Zymoseptoria tritici ST99CH_1E4 TaxID=1276532 RepID=A0A2H1GM45_ZYMTR|nr:unnamed protein product [Zymoseptoria tritici ST99CH_1E4]